MARMLHKISWQYNYGFKYFKYKIHVLTLNLPCLLLFEFRLGIRFCNLWMEGIELFGPSICG